MKDLISKLRLIPHLTLPIGFDLSAMQTELNCIDEFLPYQTITPQAYEKLRVSFLGRSLVAPDGDSRQGLSELDFKTPVEPTELAEKMPATMEAIRRLGADKFRASIMLIPAGASLYWHWHFRQPHHILTVQIPLVMPPNFWYEVTTQRNLGGEIDGLENQVVIDEKLVYRAEYPAGRPTVFNSYHWHNVFNRGVAGRITLLLYSDLTYQPFRELVVSALQDYQGPVMTE